MIKALQLLNSFKHGGGENVAFNYAIVLRELGIHSCFIAKDENKAFKDKILNNGFDTQNHITKELIIQSSYIIIHSNINVLRIAKYSHIIRKNNIRVFYIQHLNYSLIKFKILSLLINSICTDFIQITPITKMLVTKYIKIETHPIFNFYINKYSIKEWNNIRLVIRKDLNIPEKNLVYTFSGVFKPGKNVNDFITLAREYSNVSNVTFLLIGDGIENQYIKEYEGNNIIWVGFVNDVEKYLIASDYYVFTSKKEMMPMALLEAINTNCKIIAYDTELNNILLNNNTLKSMDRISVESLIMEDVTALKHYDFIYGKEKIAAMLFHDRHS